MARNTVEDIGQLYAMEWQQSIASRAKRVGASTSCADTSPVVTEGLARPFGVLLVVILFCWLQTTTVPAYVATGKVERFASWWARHLLPFPS